MNQPIPTAPATVAPGQIEFYDRIAPPLEASTNAYTLTVTQQAKNLREPATPSYTLSQPFKVSGLRFSIDPATIHATFPPSGQSGDYRDALPNIVFKDFALPWMRNIDPSGGENPTGPPWMALLTIYASEMPLPPGAPAPNTAAKLTFPRIVPTAEVFAPADAAIQGPVLTASPDDPATVLVTDVDINFFYGIAPALAELGYLAHARVVNTDGKVMLGMDDDGAFSVLVGNRVPEASTTTSLTSTVLLVSLEGHQGHLPPGTPPAGKTQIRLVVLGNWSFTATKTPGSFKDLLNRIHCRADGVGLLELPVPAGTPAPTPGTPEAMVAEALAIGYVPLANDLRDGEITTSLYRGPLVPAPTAPDPEYGGPYYFSDHAVFYDPDYGLLNVAYACAWQIGRLMALSDAHFVQMISAWRRSYAAAHHAAANQQTVVAPLAAALNDTFGLPATARLDDHVRAFFAAEVGARPARLPTVVPRSRFAALHEPGSEPAPVTGGLDPLLLLRERIRKMTS